MKKILLVSCFALVGMCASVSAQQATPRVTGKQITQQQRIKEGKASGELTRRESHRLQRKQMKIQHHKKMAKADGVVTPQERRRLNMEQKQANREIRRKKHNLRSN